MEQYLFHLIRLDIRIAHNVTLRSCHINQRYLIARAHTRHGLDSHLNAQLLACCRHCIIHLSGTAGLATVLHA